VLTLPEELTHVGAMACVVLLAQGLPTEADEVVVDARALQHFDSSALAVLLEFRRVCSRAGKTMLVQALPRRLQDLATLYGIEGLLSQA
jgi:phospholipid transport system transporter-binding protein